MSAKERDRLHYSLTTFSKCLQGISTLDMIRPERAKKSANELHALETRLVQRQTSVEEADLAYNACIAVTNMDLAPLEQCQLPSFFCYQPLDQLRNEVLLFQNFLNLKLRHREMALAAEEPIFRDAASLWQLLSLRQLRGVTAAKQLFALVQEANGYLKEGERYPLPNQELYEE